MPPPVGQRAAIAFALAILALPATPALADLALPAGALLDINNGSAPNSATNVANQFQNYSVTFDATTSGANYLLFAFREDPAYWTFGNVSMTTAAGTTNLLTDPNFVQGGTLTVNNSEVTAPASWGVIYQAGAQPEAAGEWYAPGDAPNTASSDAGLGVNEGVSGSWYDGAVGSFDGIYQGVDLTAGDDYIISFTALANDTANTSNTGDGGVELGVFAGACTNPAGAAQDCTPDNSAFVSLATPGQTVNAGRSNIDTAQPAYLASGLGTTVNPAFQGGTLQTDQPGGSYGEDFTLDNSGTNTIDQDGNASTFSGVFADAVAGTPGAITIINSASGGSVTFSGNNTYSGGTTLNGGVLQISADDNLGAPAGGIAFNGGTLRTTQKFDTSRAISVGPNGGILDNAGYNDVLSGVISGDGAMTFDGAGTTTLNAADTYTGGTTVNTGILALGPNGSIPGNITVASGGAFVPGAGTIAGPLVNQGMLLLAAGKTANAPGGATNYGELSGAGTLNGNLTNAAGGIIIAGNSGLTAAGPQAIASGGATTVEGNLTLDPNSTFEFAIAPTATPNAGPYGLAPVNAHTQLNVSGNIHLGGQAIIYASPGAYLKTTYLMISSTNNRATLTGTFAKITVPGLPLSYGYYMTYAADPQVTITVYPTAAFAASGETDNEQHVAAVLDPAVAGAAGALEAELNTIYDQPLASRTATLDQLDGEIYAGAPAALDDTVTDSWRAVFSRMGLSATPAEPDDAQAPHAWLAGVGSVGHVGGNGNYAGLDENSSGFMLGADGDWESANYGVAAGHIHAHDSAGSPGDSTLSSDLWQLGGYASAAVGGHGRAGILAGYAEGPINFTTPSVLGIAKGKSHAQLLIVEARGAWNVDLGNASTLTPIAILDTVIGNLGGPTETGLGPLDLAVPRQHAGMADARLLARYAHGWNAYGMDWTVSGSAGFRQILLQPDGKLSLRYQGIIGQAFLVQGAAPDASAALLDFGLNARLTPALSLQFSYDGAFSGNSDGNALHAQLIGKF